MAMYWKIPQIAKFPVYLTEDIYEKIEQYPVHHHDAYAIMYLINGSGRMRIGSESFAIGAESVIVVNRGEEHQIIGTPGGTLHLYNIYFSPEAFAVNARKYLINVLDTLPRSERVISVSRNALLMTIPASLREMIYEKDDASFGRRLHLKLKLAEMVLNIAFYRESSRRIESERTGMHGIMDYVRTNYFRKLSVADMAALIPIGTRQFTRIFKKETGMTFKEYVNGVRLERAKALIAAGENAVAASFQIGFESVPYFYRAFKKETGMTPNRYAEKMTLKSRRAKR